MNTNTSQTSRFVKIPSWFFVLVCVLTIHNATWAAGTANPKAGQSAQKHAKQVALPGAVKPELINRLRKNAHGAVSISTQKSTRVARFVRIGKGGDLHPGKPGRTPRGKASGFFAEYGGLFGVKNADTELVPGTTKTGIHGATRLTYKQTYKEVPVFAAVLHVHMDAKNRLTAVNGVFVPDLDLDTSPTFSVDQAAERAIAAVRDNPPENELSGGVLDLSGADLLTKAPALYVYRDGLIQGVEGTNYLVYEVEVTNGRSVREMIYINAHNGKTVNRISLIHDALFRRVYEQNISTQVWQEGDLFPGVLHQDQQNIVNFSGDSYYQFFNAFGRDAYDGAGAEMSSVNNDSGIDCPNATWNGSTTNYCNGVTSDDVVAHEWGHAYTEHTHGLIYQWQPGALNESYSDIWGEVVDMLNGTGTDSPNTPRSVNTCSIYTPVPLLTINSPASIAGNFAAGAAYFGPLLSNPGVTGDVVLADDGTNLSSDACETLANGAAISGKIALVDRGSCTFVTKVKNAQDAGAIGVIVANHTNGSVTGMWGSDATIVIPSLLVTLATGNTIKGELANGVSATLHADDGGAPEDSYRWLIGEDSTAFGGAIRDMWNPICKANPGKVTDAEYYCATGDSGGVHTNSGIPNHGFALLVDGGSYNGYTINSIGMVKAAHLYWQAQSAYQTPTTDFMDHADALQASCQDLIGIPLEGLSTTSTPAGPSGLVITASDCAAVDEMIAAVELRSDPSQCAFTPMLQQNPPAICGTIQSPQMLFFEDFEDGLAGWTPTNQGVFAGWPGLDWTQDFSLPDGRAGSAAFAADPHTGNCDGGAGDISGRMSLESPVIHIPDSSTFSTLVFSFEHYVATEAGFDGGNLKVSINGGSYALVPASAYQFNAYNTTLQSAEAPNANTNPMAGQPAFSGTDGSGFSGSWGQSQINLSVLGAQPGDDIRLRYDFGIDGCTGVDGWYTDDAMVTACPVSSGTSVNDNFSNAVVVTVTGLGGVAYSANIAATSEPGEGVVYSVGNDPAKSIWYQWTAPADTTVEFSTRGSDFNTVLEVYTGSTVDGLTSVAGNDDVAYPNDVYSKVSFTATAGTTYMIAVDGYSGDTGQVAFNWLVPLPANDDYQNAFPIGEGVTTGTLFLATADGNSNADSYSTPDVWYAYTASAAGTLHINTCGTQDYSGLDTVLSAHVNAGVAGTIANEIDSNDDYTSGTDPNICDPEPGPHNADSGIAFPVTAGDAILIRVSEYRGPEASFRLIVSLGTDSDGDGLDDDVETNTGIYIGPSDTGTAPGNPDTDGDGLNDGAEVNTYATDPTLRDSDGDGFADGVEISMGTNPNSLVGPWPPADGDLAPMGVYDGVVNVADYLVAQRMALGLIPQTALDIAHGDLQPIGTSAGVIDTADVLLILQQALNSP